VFDDIDGKLLSLIQYDFPIVSEPYKEIASELGIPEDEVMARLKKLKAEKIIRRIGASFDSKKLGYYTTLCAMIVPEKMIDAVAQVINSYPEVTHNYLRTEEYNIWFTIIAESQERLKEIIEEIKERSQIYHLINLPAVDMFKIHVHFKF